MTVETLIRAGLSNAVSAMALALLGHVPGPAVTAEARATAYPVAASIDQAGDSAAL